MQKFLNRKPVIFSITVLLAIGLSFLFRHTGIFNPRYLVNEAHAIDDDIPTLTISTISPPKDEVRVKVYITASAYVVGNEDVKSFLEVKQFAGYEGIPEIVKEIPSGVNETDFLSLGTLVGGRETNSKKWEIAMEELLNDISTKAADMGANTIQIVKTKETTYLKDDIVYLKIDQKIFY